MGEFGSCRSCRRQVYWARSAKSQKPMPLEEAPDTGNVLIDERGLAHVFGDHAKAVGARAGGIDADGNLREFGAAVYVSHHATCPQGKAWQGKTREDDDAPPPAPEPDALGSLF